MLKILTVNEVNTVVGGGNCVCIESEESKRREKNLEFPLSTDIPSNQKACATVCCGLLGDYVIDSYRWKGVQYNCPKM